MPRTIVAAALLLAAGITSAQVREGIYKPASAAPVPWSINEHQALIWGGQPYAPIGLRIDGTVQAVAAAKAAGITDVIVDLPANGSGWDEVLQALNQAGIHYLLRVNSLAPMAHGFAVEPQSYRVSGITSTRQISIDIPGATSAFVVLATKLDGTVVKSERVPIIDGKLSYLASIGPQVEHVLLVYPEMTSVCQQDFWEGLDSERDALLISLKKHSMGPGLRGIVNPMGRGLAVPSHEPRFVPTSPYFRMEFSKFLEDKYKSVETLTKNWGLTTSVLTQVDDKTKKSVTSFDQLSHLIPLWSSSRGIPGLLNPDTNTLYPCDNKRSSAWDDISQVIGAAGAKRFSRIVPSIRSVADVPVIQDWLGWAAPYETRDPVIDGLGMKVSGTSQSSLADSGARATSSILRWSTRGWLVTTDVDFGTAPDSAVQLPALIDDLASMGTKGVFIRTESPAIIKSLVAESKQRSTDTTLVNNSPQPLFFPENAYNPPVPQALPGNHWWLPSPSDGNRIDLGTLFYAYRSSLSEGTFALWARKPGRYRLAMNNTRSVRFKTLDGSDPMPKTVKNGIEVTLSEFPLIISGTMEIPVPQGALLETVERFEAMIRIAAGSRHVGGDEEMHFNEAALGFDRNPGGSFETMRKQYWKLGDKLSTYSWIEAERYSDTNFSEIVVSPGCSGGFALTLQTPIASGPEGYFADYNVTVKTREDQEVWIAAKIPPERRGEVSVSIGGQQLHITGEPLSIYEGGFGWYKLGTTRLAGNLTKLRVHVDSGGPSEIAIDTILLTPSSFTPNGVTPPDPVNFAAIKVTPARKGKRKGSDGS